ncbi:MAG: AAA family ATPase [Candidatus Pacearchaeota archaeon]
MIELKKLVLKNFKSFRSAEIPFKPGLTAIIGPNGSGKSNLLDALLFVLGETSMKSLRMNKITELINYNSPEKYAKVELRLRRDKEEITISRLIDNKGRSECRINDKKVTLNELVSLVEELGLRNKHNFIAQGDVTRIIDMNAEQRREIIDELAGIEEFELKREEAQKNLDKVNEKIKDVKLVLQERLARLEQLQKEREQAERYKSLVERKNMLKASIINAEAEEIKKEIEKHSLKLKECQEKVSKKTSEKEKIKEKIEEIEKKSEDLTKKIVEEQQQILCEFSEKTEKLRTELRLAEELINLSTKNLTNIESQENLLANELQQNLKRLEEERMRLENIKKEMEKLEENISSLEEEIEIASKEIEIVKEKRNETENDVAYIEREIERLQGMIKAKQKALGELHGENEIRKIRIKELSEKLKETENLKKDLEKLREQFKLLQAKSLEDRLLKLQSMEKDLTIKEGLLSDKIEQLKATIKSIENISAKCPVCNTNLTQDKKNKIREMKNKELKQAELQMVEIRDSLKGIRDEIKQVEIDFSFFTRIRQEIQKKEEEVAKIAEIENQILQEKNMIKDTKKIVDEIAELEQKISSLQKEKISKKEFLDELSYADYAQKYADLSELKNKLSELESSKAISENNIDIISERIETSRARIKELSQERKQLLTQKEVKMKEIESLKKELANLEDKKLKRSDAISALLGEKERLSALVQKLKTELNLIDAEISKADKEINELRVEIGKAEVRLADLEEELKEIPQPKIINEIKVKEMKKMLAEVEKELESIGAVNLRASEAVREEEEALLEIKSKIEKLEEEQAAVLDMIQKIEIKKKEIFMECFEKINKNFSDMFYNFFGGTGKLSLTDYEDINKAGLIIEARYKENMQSIDAMSGGEKTLTALAFIFAILLYNPAPLYVLDETDAALDEVNSIKVSKVLEELSKKSHIIIITHNNVVIRYAMQVLGVTLSKSGSQIVGLDLTKHLAENNTAQ